MLCAGTSHRQIPKRQATWVRAGRFDGGRGLAWVEPRPVTLSRAVSRPGTSPGCARRPASGEHAAQAAHRARLRPARGPRRRRCRGSRGPVEREVPGLEHPRQPGDLARRTRRSRSPARLPSSTGAGCRARTRRCRRRHSAPPRRGTRTGSGGRSRAPASPGRAGRRRPAALDRRRLAARRRRPGHSATTSYVCRCSSRSSRIASCRPGSIRSCDTRCSTLFMHVLNASRSRQPRPSEPRRVAVRERHLQVEEARRRRHQVLARKRRPARPAVPSTRTAGTSPATPIGQHATTEDSSLRKRSSKSSRTISCQGQEQASEVDQDRFRTARRSPHGCGRGVRVVVQAIVLVVALVGTRRSKRPSGPRHRRARTPSRHGPVACREQKTVATPRSTPSIQDDLAGSVGQGAIAVDTVVRAGCDRYRTASSLGRCRLVGRHRVAVLGSGSRLRTSSVYAASPSTIRPGRRCLDEARRWPS